MQKMTLTPEEKTKIIQKYSVHEKDTGSAAVQIALFTEEIKRLTDHLKKHPKDNHSRTGILKMVSKRKRLLDYLREVAPKVYNSVTKDLGLRK
jgi:small subunit ribosomal protein S15